MSVFLSLPPDLIRLAAHELSFDQIVALSLSNQFCYNSIWRSPPFWRGEAQLKLTSYSDVAAAVPIMNIIEGLIIRELPKYVDINATYGPIKFLASNGFDKVFVAKNLHNPHIRRSEFDVKNWISLARASGHNQFAQDIYNRYNQILEQRSRFSFTETDLTTAALTGNLLNVMNLVPHVRDKEYLIDRSIHLAAQRGHKSVVMYLLTRVPVTQPRLQFALSSGALEGHSDMVIYLMRHFRNFIQEQPAERKHLYFPVIAAARRSNYVLINRILDDPLMSGNLLTKLLDDLLETTEKIWPTRTEMLGLEGAITILEARLEQLI